MFSRQVSLASRRHVLSQSKHISSSSRSLASRDLLERSAKPTTAPPKLNIYRDVWPPLISCVGVALVAYYGLEMWRLNLDYKYRLQDMASEVEALRAEADKLREENEAKSASLGSRMFGGNKDSSSSQGRAKWFGIF